MADYVYDPAKRQWVDAQTGVPLSALAVIAEMNVQQESARDMLLALTEQLYAGQITIEQWQMAVASVLKDVHLGQAAFGAGGKRFLVPAALAQVSDTLKQQYGFLQDFALAILGGLGLAAALNRVLMYSGATQQSFWQTFSGSKGGTQRIIWALGNAEHCDDCVRLANGSPYTSATLPTYPGAGATQCLNNCKCHLEFI